MNALFSSCFRISCSSLKDVKLNKGVHSTIILRFDLWAISSRMTTPIIDSPRWFTANLPPNAIHRTFLRSWISTAADDHDQYACESPQTLNIRNTSSKSPSPVAPSRGSPSWLDEKFLEYPRGSRTRIFSRNFPWIFGFEEMLCINSRRRDLAGPGIIKTVDAHTHVLHLSFSVWRTSWSDCGGGWP